MPHQQTCEPKKGSKSCEHTGRQSRPGRGMGSEKEEVSVGFLVEGNSTAHQLLIPDLTLRSDISRSVQAHTLCFLPSAEPHASGASQNWFPGSFSTTWPLGRRYNGRGEAKHTCSLQSCHRSYRRCRRASPHLGLCCISRPPHHGVCYAPVSLAVGSKDDLCQNHSGRPQVPPGPAAF